MDPISYDDFNIDDMDSEYYDGVTEEGYERTCSRYDSADEDYIDEQY